MSKFNENPFKKNTQVKCFSNGNDYMLWLSSNCNNKCKRYFKNHPESNCNLNDMIILSGKKGFIPLHIVKKIGAKYDPLYCQAKLNQQCREYSCEGSPF